MNTTSVIIAFYLLLSLFPLLIAVGNILPLFQIDSVVVIDYIEGAVPQAVMPVLEPIIRNLLTSGSGGLFSISLLGAIWSSSKSVTFIRKGLNKAYGIEDTSSFIVKKLVSIATILLVLLLLVVFLLVFSFSDMLLGTLEPAIPWAEGLLQQVKNLKWPVALLFLISLLTMVYKVTPDVKVRIRDVLPGAAFATAGLMLLVQGFAIYLQFSARSFSSYGALGTFFVLMFWLNFSAMIVLLGAVLNASISEYRFGKARGDVSGVDQVVERTRKNLLNRVKALLEKLRRGKGDASPTSTGEETTPPGDTPG